jgi:hypothetical protein
VLSIKKQKAYQNRLSKPVKLSDHEIVWSNQFNWLQHAYDILVIILQMISVDVNQQENGGSLGQTHAVIQWSIGLIFLANFEGDYYSSIAEGLG